MPKSERKPLSAIFEDPEVEQFVRGGKTNTQLVNMPARRHANMLTSQHAEVREPVAVKIPKSIAAALWDAMNQRKTERKKGTLEAGQVWEKQDIVAEALKDWLQKHGYLS
jgi:hypothetical protein